MSSRWNSSSCMTATALTVCQQVELQELPPPRRSSCRAWRPFFIAWLGAARLRGEGFGELDVGGVVRLRARRRSRPRRSRRARGTRASRCRRSRRYRRPRRGSAAEPGEDAGIGVVHVAVLALEVGVVGVEGVSVLHDEFARAHDAEARPALVAELGLDLVEVHRQPPVALELGARDVGDHLLRGRLDHELALVAVAKAQQLRPILPASAPIPATAPPAAPPA